MSPPSTSYAPLLPPATDDVWDILRLVTLPATPNAFNVGALVVYVVCTPVLAYDAYAGGPDEWALCLLFYAFLVFLVMLVNLYSGLLLEERDRHVLPT